MAAVEESPRSGSPCGTSLPPAPAEDGLPRLWAAEAESLEPPIAAAPPPIPPPPVIADPGPQTDLELLLDRLNRNLGFAESLQDPAEPRASTHPLAALNSYRHRLQAARASCANAQLRAEEAQARVHDLEDRLRLSVQMCNMLQAELSALRSSRAWRITQALHSIRLQLQSLWAAIQPARSR